MKRVLYLLLEWITFKRGITKHISGFSIRIPARYHRYFEHNYELNNLSFINNYVKEGDIALDIGAHIGLLSVAMGQKVGTKGKVYSFEPTDSTFGILKETIRINGKKEIVVPINAAVSDKNGKAAFYVTDIDAHNSNSLSNNHRDYGNEKSVEVNLFSIDSFSLENKFSRVDFIKIDAEGAEYSVLKGASNVLTEFKPFVILALHPSSIVNFGDNLLDIWNYVRSKNYLVYHLNQEVDKDFFISQENLFDVFLIPLP